MEGDGRNETAKRSSVREGCSSEYAISKVYGVRAAEWQNTAENALNKISASSSSSLCTARLPSLPSPSLSLAICSQRRMQIDRHHLTFSVYIHSGSAHSHHWLALWSRTTVVCISMYEQPDRVINSPFCTYIFVSPLLFTRLFFPLILYIPTMFLSREEKKSGKNIPNYFLSFPYFEIGVLIRAV